MIKKITKFLAYSAAAIVVLMAVAVGLLRIALPQLPEYRDEIQMRIAAAVDGDVSFATLDARWRLRGPEIVFTDFVIGPEVASRDIEPLRIDTLGVGVSVSDLLFNQALVIRRLSIDGVRIGVVRGDVDWRIQALALAPDTERSAGESTDFLASLSPVDIAISDVSVRYVDEKHGRDPVLLDIVEATLNVTTNTVRFAAELGQTGARSPSADLLLSGNVAGLRAQQVIDGDWVASAELDGVSALLVKQLLPSDGRWPTSGQADAVVDVHWSRGQLESIAVNLEAEQLVPSDGGSESAVSGRAEWTRRGDGWLCAIDDFVVGVSDRRWPAASLNLRSSGGAESDERIEFDAANVTVYDMPYLSSFLPKAIAEDLRATELAGTVVRADGFVQLNASVDEDDMASAFSRLTDYELNAEFEGLTVASIGKLPGFSNLTGEVRMKTAAGSLSIRSQSASLNLPAVFQSPLVFDDINGTVIWRSNDRGVTLLSDSIRLSSGPLSNDASLELLIPKDDTGIVIDLTSRWALADVSAIDTLLPKRLMSPKLASWLNDALIAGRIENGRARLFGNLNDFPFSDDNGEFSASGNARDVTMRYARRWPAITALNAALSLDGMRLATSVNDGISEGIRFVNSRAAFEDLRSGVLSVDLKGQERLGRVYTFAAKSPLRELFGTVFDDIQVGGDTEYQLSLTVPLKAIPDYGLDANFDTIDASFGIKDLPVGASSINGRFNVDRAGVSAQDVQAIVFERPATLALRPVSSGEGYGLQLDVQSVLPAAAITDSLKVPLKGRVDGETPYTAKILLPKSKLAPGETVKPVRVEWRSNLQGLDLALPYPAGKSSDQRVEADIVLEVENGLAVDLALDSGISLVAAFDGGKGESLVLERATVHLGFGRALLPLVPGLFIDGDVDWVRLDDWLDLDSDGGADLIEKLQSISVSVDTLYAFGQKIDDARSILQSGDVEWLIDIRSPSVAGNIVVPKVLEADDAIVRMDMDRLFLLESDPEATSDSDPTTIPALRIRAADFALGEKRFGQLEADVARSPNGLVISQLKTQAPAFNIAASGDWLLDPVEESGSRTRLNAHIESNDVKAMMESLGYQPGINANEFVSDVELSWGGGPSEQFVASLDGKATVAISNGTLDDVEPGAGRVVGLMSVAELPRRLALDFRDVFRKGFSFDQIEGDFRMVNGDAYTCNLNLQGSSADVGLIGRASLDKRNYNQTAIVSVKVGNTLPAVGAVVAGPQVGAALLIFSQIFKKPLQGMTEVFYQINGGWDEPSIDRTDSARFAATAELAGCLVDTGN